MTRRIKIAAVQMDARPARTAERLQRAEALVAEAAEAGAQLVVLPEVFNTGYEYSEANYSRAEPMDGPTVTWMKRTAAVHGVHLAGTLMLLDDEDIYNAMLIVAPDRQTWRYDKNYPWLWERAYFREGRDITIAETDLGRLGMMICWDQAHRELWARYAGKVHAMVICSSPPTMHDLTLTFPDGQQMPPETAGPIFKYVKELPCHAEMFGALPRRQSGHLGVPVVSTTGTGAFDSAVPAPYLSVAVYTMMRPDLWGKLGQADAVRVTAAGYFNETYIADAAGQVMAQAPEGEEAYVMAEVPLADAPPQPSGPQPRFGASFLTYLLSDHCTALMIPTYRCGVRRAYGGRMAPVSYQTKVWLGALAAAGALAGAFGYLLGRLTGKQG